MRYRCFNESVPGLKYQKKGWNCQDYSYSYETQNYKMIVVDDGHGSKDCFRSDIGAKFGAQAAIKELKRYLKNDDLKNSMFSETGIKNFKYDLWKEWRRLVKKHWKKEKMKKNGVGIDERRYETVSDNYKIRYESDDENLVEKNLYTAYGTTMVLAISIESQILLLQIGDGTCVVLYDDGIMECPIPNDDRNFLNVVVSMCEEDAYRSIRHKVINCKTTSHKPVAVFLSSDGLDDCFPVYKNNEYLYKVYSALLDSVINNGFVDTEFDIKNSLLPEISSKISQDDISLAYMICTDISVLKSTLNNIDCEFKDD